MTTCVGCGSVVNWNEVREACEDVLEQIDIAGMESLTETAQVLAEGKLCVDCWTQGRCP